ncbi:Phosphoglycerate kinase [Aphelenchoides fujianensis]|nr:Phosphoglycerate kinase [Aphelenchoides fujianensis]
MTFRTLDTADLAGKRALVRVDFNVPVDGGKVAKVVLLAHFDRPKGKVVPEMSLGFVAEPLSKLLEQPVAFAGDCVGPAAATVVNAMENGGVALLENVRFHAGEEKNDPAFAKALAANGDLYVNDAFSAAHRAHASTEGLARLLPAYPGLAMQRELEALDAALGKPKKPVIGIVGGSKVSTKLDLLRNLVTKLDYLAIGGGMANTFLYAAKIDVGGLATARQIIDLAGSAGCKLLLPTDVVVAQEVKPGVASSVRNVYDVRPDDRILDAGPETVATLNATIDKCETLIWNGPLGVFEVPPFDKATVSAAKHVSERAKSGKLVAVAGGGDTVAALNHAGVAADMTFVSTAGGAFLEWMEGKTLPGVAALEV